MAYRTPKFIAGHALRDLDAGIGSIGGSTPYLDTGSLKDDRISDAFEFGSSWAGNTIIIDLGAGPPELDLMVVPIGHNWNLKYVQVVESSTIIFDLIQNLRGPFYIGSEIRNTEASFVF